MDRCGAKWTHDEIVIALGLYFQIPFGKINQATPEVVRIARLMGRKPSSLSMKMGNIGRLDPTLARRGISGLKNGAKIEEEVWREYVGRREELAEAYSELILGLHGNFPVEDDQQIKTPPGLVGQRLMRYRINQTFFRQSVISAYDYTCCITGIRDPRLLIASHIKPWARCETGEERTIAENGLCLNPLHDRAFDKGPITLDEDLRVVHSPSLRDALSRQPYADHFAKYEGVQIRLPARARPAQRFLRYHRNFVFIH